MSENVAEITLGIRVDDKGVVKSFEALDKRLVDVNAKLKNIGGGATSGLGKVRGAASGASAGLGQLSGAAGGSQASVASMIKTLNEKIKVLKSMEIMLVGNKKEHQKLAQSIKSQTIGAMKQLIAQAAAGKKSFDQLMDEMRQLTQVSNDISGSEAKLAKNLKESADQARLKARTTKQLKDEEELRSHTLTRFNAVIDRAANKDASYSQIQAAGAARLKVLDKAIANNNNLKWKSIRTTDEMKAAERLLMQERNTTIEQMYQHTTVLEAFEREVKDLEQELKNVTAKFKQGDGAVAAHQVMYNKLKTKYEQMVAVSKRVKFTNDKQAESHYRLVGALQKQMLQADAAQQNMAHMGRANSHANLVLLDSSRVVEDFAFGIRGVANNITPLIMSWQRYNKSLAEGEKPMKNLLKSMKGPNGLIIAISLITTAWIMWDNMQRKKKKTDKATVDGLDALRDKIKEVREEVEALIRANREELGDTTAMFTMEEIAEYRHVVEEVTRIQGEMRQAMNEHQEQMKGVANPAAGSQYGHIMKPYQEEMKKVFGEIGHEYSNVGKAIELIQEKLIIALSDRHVQEIINEWTLDIKELQDQINKPTDMDNLLGDMNETLEDLRQAGDLMVEFEKAGEEAPEPLIRSIERLQHRFALLTQAIDQLKKKSITDLHEEIQDLDRKAVHGLITGLEAAEGKVSAADDAMDLLTKQIEDGTITAEEAAPIFEEIISQQALDRMHAYRQAWLEITNEFKKSGRDAARARELDVKSQVITDVGSSEDLLEQAEAERALIRSEIDALDALYDRIESRWDDADKPVLDALEKVIEGKEKELVLAGQLVVARARQVEVEEASGKKTEEKALSIEDMVKAMDEQLEKENMLAQLQGKGNTLKDEALRKEQALVKLQSDMADAGYSQEEIAAVTVDELEHQRATLRGIEIVNNNLIEQAERRLELEKAIADMAAAQIQEDIEFELNLEGLTASEQTIQSLERSLNAYAAEYTRLRTIQEEGGILTDDELLDLATASTMVNTLPGVIAGLKEAMAEKPDGGGWLKDMIDDWDLYEKAGEQAIELLDQLMSNSFQNRRNELNELKKDTEDRYKNELSNVRLTDNMRKQIEARRAKDMEKISDKQNELRRKEAVYAKKMAIFEATINIAKAITEVIAKPWLAYVVAAMGAAQLGAIAAAPIPSFDEGVTNFGGGIARVHQDELLVNLPSGTNVITNENVERLAQLNEPVTPDTSASNELLADIVDGIFDVQGSIREQTERLERVERVVDIREFDERLTRFQLEEGR